jgi:hypothetical protein
MGINYRASTASDLPKGDNIISALAEVRIVADATINGCTIRKDGAGQQTFVFNASETQQDTDAIATFLGVSNGFFKEWGDQSGSADTAVRQYEQLTTANQPSYVREGINGRMAFQSDIPVTVDKYLQTAHIFGTAIAGTYFAVVNIVDSASQSDDAAIFDNRPLASNSAFSLTLLSGNIYFRITDETGVTDNSATAAIASGAHILAVVCDGVDNIKLFIDGASTPDINKTVANGFKNRLDNPKLGGFGGLFADFKVFNAALSDTERGAYETDMSNTYNITLV